MPDVSDAAFLGMMHYLYTNTLENTAPPEALCELMRSKCSIFDYWYQHIYQILDFY